MWRVCKPYRLPGKVHIEPHSTSIPRRISCSTLLLSADIMQLKRLHRVAVGYRVGLVCGLSLPLRSKVHCTFFGGQPKKYVMD